uniref:Putative site-specific DNA endonuclease n=1 Tax=Pleodorina starrii TaxID=330485 RepID=M9P834_9CHLO|nr:putative site-specific DNA endonuclease [Pleodorina starrii]YP_007890196.1 putative site-specific DNA endonuclease [Pleodorina starrii]AFY64421.1 putative site-specific DNA endonuclease [Pleodorina starrii]AFY64462.1 putative site-specific DNA endonuclease [Pleodorina starrii]
MSIKKTIQFYADLADGRGHELVSVSNTETPSQGTVTIFCKNCNNKFTTSAVSYQNARKTGCPNCKAKAVQEFWTGKSRTKSPEETAKQAVIIKHKQKLRKEKSLAYANLQGPEDLKQKLLSEPNPYNDFIVTHLDKPVVGKLTEGSTPLTLKGLEADEVGPLLGKAKLEKHHIIPLHAGGPDVPWNLIYLTPEDHIKAHELRALVYNEPGDRYAVRLRGNGTNLSERRLEANRLGDQTRFEQGTGIYAPGASAKGGRIGGAVKSHLKDLKHASKMTDVVSSALYEGSRWKHQKTGVVVTIKPQTVFTLPQLVDKLIEALPSCPDKDLLSQAQTTTITCNLARVIKKQRTSAYGWTLL